MAYLAQQEIHRLIEAMIGSGLDTNEQRPALLTFVAPGLTAHMSAGNPAGVQLLRDLNYLNNIDRIADGTVPLEIYLRNADLLFAGRDDIRKVIRELLDKVVRRSTGAPRVDLAAVREMREQIVHVDDTVTYAFMRAGYEAAGSVMKLRVPRIEHGQPVLRNGNPVKHVGTGWLLAKSLVMTNHHVVNAREEGEPDAADGDLRLQGKGTVGLLDYDADAAEGIDLAVGSLEAWDAGLDYAVLRIAPTDRRPLRRAREAVAIGVDPVPVNIIQHPGGRGKRYGIRNNLLHEVTPTKLFYFTDTDNGSSGSPVFNDNWEVVGLHRASEFVENVSFQGKATAYVNQGTPMPAILADIAQRFPALAAEIAA
jgi:V8-like Glu-specific endopeptidase